MQVVKILHMMLCSAMSKDLAPIVHPSKLPDRCQFLEYDSAF